MRRSPPSRFGATIHVVAPEPTSAGRHVPMLRDTWWRVVAHFALCLDLKLVYGGTRSVGCRQIATTRNTVVGCALLEAVHLEPLLDRISTTVQDLNNC
jgi:hypothetical protein